VHPTVLQPEGTGDCASHSTAARGSERFCIPSGAARGAGVNVHPIVVQPEGGGDSVFQIGAARGKGRFLHL
jgi:hypothetical protein